MKVVYGHHVHMFLTLLVRVGGRSSLLVTTELHHLERLLLQFLILQFAYFKQVNNLVTIMHQIQKVPLRGNITVNVCQGPSHGSRGVAPGWD